MDPQFTMILKNTILPIKIENRKYATIEHYVLSSLLKDPSNQDLLLSYPIDKIRSVFNYYDQEQYMRVVYEACNKFNEKKCRSLEKMGNATLGSMTRSIIKNHDDFIYKTSVEEPFHSVLGLDEVENMLYGYNIIGHSIRRMKYVLDKLPDLSGPMEYIFWKSHPEYQNIKPSKNSRTYKTITKAKKRKEKNVEEEDEIVDYFLNDGDDDDDEEREEAGYNPDEVVPVYTNDRVRWIATSVNSRLDDMRDVGAQADFLYSTDAPLTDPFHNQDDLYSRIDPLSIFKIYKAAEHLVGLMRNGMDIRAFLNKPVDAILWECKVSPELFGIDPRSLDPKQRHMIYVEYWHKFISKTIPYYHLIEKEIMYPQNLTGFVRKEYAMELNDRIGQKIREILFASFIYQVIETSYPHVAPELRIIIMAREMKSFSGEEYEEITNKLYHLFFQKKFQLDDEGVRRVMLLESSRLTTEEIENVIGFVPCKILSTPSLDIKGTILDPMTTVDIKIDDRVFHDLYQYIFYRLFIFYGSCAQNEAYKYLFQEGEMMKGTNPQLQTILNDMINSKKEKYVKQGILAKLQQYPQANEIILYSRATKTPIMDEALWNGVEVNQLDLQLMKWVVSVIPSGDFEKSIHLYSFLHDMTRSLNIMKSIVGRRLQQKSLEVFIRCFYSKLDRINKGIKIPKTRMPAGFSSYIEGTKTISETSIDELWKAVHPLVYIFQQKKFVPSELFLEAKQANPSVSKDEMIRALANVVRCLYPDQEVSNDQFYLLTQMISGKDEIPMWTDPSFELIRQVEDDQESFAHLPEEIRKRLPKRKKKTKKEMENVSFNIVHSSFENKRKDIQDAFGRPTAYDPVVSRASYALAALEKETIHPRRIVFYL